MGALLKTALVGWWNDRAMSLGASIAFFTVFSLAPMLLVDDRRRRSRLRPGGGPGRDRRPTRGAHRRSDCGGARSS